jgi:hypothetical protein
MKSPSQITPITILQKCQKCHPWLEIISKVGHFQGKSFRLFAVALRLFPSLDGVFSLALQKRRATAVKVKRRHLVAEMWTLQTDKPTKPSCPISWPGPCVKLWLSVGSRVFRPGSRRFSAAEASSRARLPCRAVAVREKRLRSDCEAWH